MDHLWFSYWRKEAHLWIWYWRRKTIRSLVFREGRPFEVCYRESKGKPLDYRTVEEMHYVNQSTRPLLWNSQTHVAAFSQMHFLPIWTSSASASKPRTNSTRNSHPIFNSNDQQHSPEELCVHASSTSVSLASSLCVPERYTTPSPLKTTTKNNSLHQLCSLPVWAPSASVSKPGTNSL